MAVKKLNFEQSLSRLEEIVDRLEGGELALSDSMKLFEEGAGLVAACTKMLDDAEQKVSVLKITENGKAVEQPFEPEDRYD